MRLTSDMITASLDKLRMLDEILFLEFSDVYTFLNNLQSSRKMGNLSRKSLAATPTVHHLVIIGAAMFLNLTSVNSMSLAALKYKFFQRAISVVDCKS